MESKSPKRHRPPSSSNDQNSSHEKIPKRRTINKLYTTIKGIYNFTTTDVNFVFEINGQEVLIPAHKAILALRSPVFRQMFFSEYFLEKKGDVLIVDATIDEFVLFIRSFYENRIEFTEANIHGMAYLADKYNMVTCEQMCIRFLNELLGTNFLNRVEAVFWILPLASQFNYTSLRNICIQRVQVLGNFLMQQSEFLNCSRATLQEILQVDFVGRNEKILFEHCIDWAKHACVKEHLDPNSQANLRAQLGNCFKLIRFKSMSIQEFIECLGAHAKIFTTDEIQQFSTVITRKAYPADITRYFPAKPRRKTTQSFQASPSAQVYEFDASFAEMYDDKTTADIFFTFVNDNRQLAAHKCILAAKSFGFEQQFMELDDTNTIHVTDSSFQVFDIFLQSFYRKPTIGNLNKEFVDNVLLNVLLLVKKNGAVDLHLEDCLVDSLNDGNVFWMNELSQKYSLDHLYIVSCDYIKAGGIELLSTDGFINANRDALKIVSILHFRATKVQSLLICNAFIKWAETFCSRNHMDLSGANFRIAFRDAFASIPFANMNLTDFAFFQRKHDGLFTNEDIRNIMNDFTKQPSNRLDVHSTVADAVVDLEAN